MDAVEREVREDRRGARSACAAICALVAWVGAAGGALAQEPEEETTARSSVVALDDFTGLRVAPEVGFGWQLQELDSGDQDQLFRYGLQVDYQMNEMRVRGSLQHMLYTRTYLGAGVNIDGQGLQQIAVDEQAIHAEAAFVYDLAEPLEVAWRDLSLGLYGGLQTRQLINDVFPATLFGVLTGAEGGLWLARDLRFTASVDYTHNLGRLLLSPESSSFGDALGLMRYGGAVGMYFKRDTMFSIGYQGTWIALEKADFLENAFVVSLSMATPL